MDLYFEMAYQGGSSPAVIARSSPETSLRWGEHGTASQSPALNCKAELLREMHLELTKHREMLLCARGNGARVETE